MSLTLHKQHIEGAILAALRLTEARELQQQQAPYCKNPPIPTHGALLSLASRFALLSFHVSRVKNRKNSDPGAGRETSPRTELRII